jgi:hypothetical protein
VSTVAERRGIMPEQPAELNRLASIAVDRELAADMRMKAVELMGKIGTRDALLALLELVANEELVIEERDLALKQAREILRARRG